MTQWKRGNHPDRRTGSLAYRLRVMTSFSPRTAPAHRGPLPTVTAVRPLVLLTSSAPSPILGVMSTDQDVKRRSHLGSGHCHGTRGWRRRSAPFRPRNQEPVRPRLPSPGREAQVPIWPIFFPPRGGHGPTQSSRRHRGLSVTGGRRPMQNASTTKPDSLSRLRRAN